MMGCIELWVSNLMRSLRWLSLLLLVLVAEGGGTSAAPGNPAGWTSKMPPRVAATGPVVPLSYEKELETKRAGLDAKDVEGRINLGKWCRDRQMWEAMADLAREALVLEPESKAAYELLHEYDDNVSLAIVPETEKDLTLELQEHVGHEFKTHRTRHFLIAYDTSEVFSSTRGAYLEKAYDSFMYSFNMQKLRPDFLKQRLVVILFKERHDYQKYASKTDGAMPSWAIGYYSQRTNRSAFYDDQTGPQAEDVQAKLDEARAQLRNLAQQANQAQAAGQSRQANAIMTQRQKLSTEILVLENKLNVAIGHVNTIKTIHEACHQLAFNTGIQKRQVDYPLWLSEGLACSFESDNRQALRGPLVLNPPRVTVLREALANGTLWPLNRVLGGPTGGNLTEKEAGTFYAESWGLFHYLYKFQRPALEKYLLEYQAQKGAGKIPPAAQKKMFTDAFGADMAELEGKWRGYVKEFK
ncbi:MAG: DUF1570 domain-containing protein [Phycisphaerae bacterium]